MVLALQRLSEGSQLKQLEQLPNFFFEDLGEARLFHEDWKLVSYVDLGENLVIERNINTAISKISLTCTQVKKLSCEQNALALSKRLIRIIRDRKRLYASLGYKYNEKHKVYADNKKLVTLVQNQTQILKLTIQNTENLARDLKRKMLEFDNVTSILYKNLNKIESATKNNREVIEPIEITEYLEICISEYDQTINILINSVLAALSGQIGLQLLEPFNLKTSLEHMATVLRISRMPLPVDETHFFEYLRISEIFIVVTANKLIFEIRLPMVEEESYDTYRIIPLPKDFKQHIFQYITIPHDYVFVDKLHLTLYRPVVDYLTFLFYGRFKEVRLQVARRTGLIQLLDNHRWIFIAPIAETIHVHCKGKIKEFLIKKVGLLTLEPGCLAITPDTTLQSDQTIETLSARHYESPFLYTFNSSAFREPAFKLDLIRIPKLSQIHANPSMLRNVGKELDEIIQEAENIRLVGLIIFYVSLKFKIVQTIAHWFIRKPCTMIFNNCFNIIGQNVCGQETVNREVYFHNKPSREFATIEVPSKTDGKDKVMRRYISPVLDDLV
ncbi:hypothetical protein M0802_012721 [Mischocyttarus mexicanus]|nr:hypothetical protein M0802_012721 [Mischocyttarus mexicanus]